VAAKWGSITTLANTFKPMPLNEAKVKKWEELIEKGQGDVVKKEVGKMSWFQYQKYGPRLFTRYSIKKLDDAYKLYYAGNVDSAIIEVSEGAFLFNFDRKGLFGWFHNINLGKAGNLRKHGEGLADCIFFLHEAGRDDREVTNDLIETVEYYDTTNTVIELIKARMELWNGNYPNGISRYQRYAKKMDSLHALEEVPVTIKEVWKMETNLCPATIATLYKVWLLHSNPGNFTQDNLMRVDFRMIGEFTGGYNKYLSGEPIRKGGPMQALTGFCQNNDESQDALAVLQCLSLIAPTVEPEKKDFLHVNPLIVKWASDNVVPAPEMKIGDKTFKDVYKHCFTKFVRPFAVCYLFLTQEADTGLITQEYKDSIIAGGDIFDAVSFLQNRFNALSFQKEYGYPVISEIMGFWLRRNIDGSSDELWAALEKVLTLYDTEWLNNARANIKTEIKMREFKEEEKIDE